MKPEITGDFDCGRGFKGENKMIHQHFLREKFRSNPTALYDNEILTLTGVKLPKEYEPIGKWLDMSIEELMANGLSEVDAIVIKSIKEIATRYLSQRMERKDFFSCPEKAIDFLRMKIGGLPHEAFMAIFLNTQNEMIGHEVVNEGTVDQVAVYPRRIVEKCLRHHAAGVVVAHNHPSGYTDPSEEDKRLTRALKEACALLDIRLIDHLVVGKSGYFSFLEKGLI